MKPNNRPVSHHLIYSMKKKPLLPPALTMYSLFNFSLASPRIRLKGFGCRGAAAATTVSVATI